MPESDTTVARPSSNDVASTTSILRARNSDSRARTLRTAVPAVCASPLSTIRTGVRATGASTLHHAATVSFVTRRIVTWKGPRCRDNNARGAQTSAPQHRIRNHYWRAISATSYRTYAQGAPGFRKCADSASNLIAKSGDVTRTFLDEYWRQSRTPLADPLGQFAPTDIVTLLRLSGNGHPQASLYRSGTSLSEVLFGLIMTLTFTLGAGLIIQEEGREGARQLLIATIGCNIAWGIIDGALYLVGPAVRSRPTPGHWVRPYARPRTYNSCHEGRRRRARRNAEPVTTEAERGASTGASPGNIRSERRCRGQDRHWQGRRGSAPWRVSGWCSCQRSGRDSVPADRRCDFALRVSNAILLALLFATGYWWSRFTLGRPWLVGLCFLLGGVGLVAVAIALGG